MPQHQFATEILRQYDIRGTIGENLNSSDAYAIGYSFGLILIERSGKPACDLRVSVGRDGRLSSPELAQNLTQGLSDAGIAVLTLPCGPTPMLYFADRHYATDGAIMVTGSHNPPDMNGFKMVMGHRPFFGADIQELDMIAAQTDLQPQTCKGIVVARDCRTAYVDRLCAEVEYWPEDYAPNIAWDAGNGAAGEVLEILCARLPGTHHLLYTEIDGTFPNHHPDPTIPAHLVDLQHKIHKENCDFGIAFDGDGDRIGVMAADGTILWGDRMLMILASDVLGDHPKATVIADVKASGALFRHIAALGGVPDMYKTGHALIKSRMAETGALLAGEMSGHLFFADRYYGFDDALYAALRLMGAVARRKKSLSQIIADFPTPYATPEIRVSCPEDQKARIIAETKARLEAEGVRYNAMDGMRVDVAGGWWLMRASNTEPVLVLRAEAESPEALESLWQTVSAYVAVCGLQPIFYRD